MPKLHLALAATAMVVMGTSSGAQSTEPAGLDALTHGRVAGLEVGERVSVKRIVLPSGVAVDLDLERFEVLAPGARLIVQGPSGPIAMAPPELVLLRGAVVGDPESRVFMSVSPHGTEGFIKQPGAMHFISNGPHTPGLERGLRLVDAASLPPAQAGPPSACGTLSPARPLPQAPAAAGEPPCRVARVAIETDWEFTGSIFGGNTAASATYAITLLAAVSEIFQADLNTRLFVTYVRVWSANVDPYVDGDDLHTQFKEHWNQFFDDVPRDVAHMLSGRENLPWGGIAWLNAVCTATGYGVSAYLNGSFPYPLQDNNSGNWDVVVVSHELGHNFGAIHTHNYFPPIDNCGNGSCQGAANGTIMSYCHTCSGGIANIELIFHPLLVIDMLQFLDGAGCNLTAGDTAALDDSAVSIGANPVVIDVLANDLLESCDAATVVLATFDTATATGGSIVLVPPAGTLLRPQLQYTPAPGFEGADSFQYSLIGGESATVTVDAFLFRPAEKVGKTLPGLGVRYYQLQSPSALPDFDGLTSYATDVSEHLNYPSTDGPFATSGLADGVGCVFEGYFEAANNYLYTFSLESDDGSRLLIGDQVVVDNDGLHGMVTASGQIALAEGFHSLRIEFFENTGGAGLIARIAIPNHDPAPILPPSLSHAPPCEGDVNGDFVVDVQDLTAVVLAWGAPGGPADVNGDGVVNVQDLVMLLTAWGTCD